MLRSLVQKYKKKLLLPTTVITIILFFVIQSQFKSAPPTADVVQPIPFENSFEENQEDTTEYVEDIAIFVEVKGAVNNPGVYELTDGDRVLNAIELAGGYLAMANSKNINHAQRVVDEMVIYVPLEGEEIEASETIESTQSANSNLVNINKADATMLTTLPGVGPAKAEAILAYREGTGNFKEKQDLMNVTGIGQKTFEKLEPLITVK
ncbi:competence protein ComEA [Psychrobacillus lasiicapitis]|uniref:Competence protein ComEA n=1 Tax=Psychrobacillus lasiicapitis TaxID=1636719 RepID=A0A544TAW6_9BACI|nr:competence protein ComEA [Psychrobacillus lasiicapitis]